LTILSLFGGVRRDRNLHARALDGLGESLAFREREGAIKRENATSEANFDENMLSVKN
jgi:hypothetical protein